MKYPVCVVIPTYNRASLILETLNSILTQKAPVSEIIVVDDGSTDDTKNILSRLGNHIRLVAVENGGECRARNIGVAVSRQPWIAFCDSDDLWREDKLEQQMELHLTRSDVRYSFTNFRELDNGTITEETKFAQAPEPFRSLLYAREEGYTVCERSIYNDLLAFQPVWPSSLLMHRDFFTDIGSWREELGRTPSVDLEFHLRCARHPPIGILHEPLLTVRKHDGNFSGNAKKTTEGEISILRFVAEHHGVSAKTEIMIQHQIRLRQADQCYGMFYEGLFDDYLNLYTSLPASYLDSKARLKSLICRLPWPVAKLLHSALIKKTLM